MTTIAVINSSTKLDASAFPFLVEACRLQLLEFCTAWNLDPWAVAPYESAATLPASDVYIFEYVDKLDVDGALAYHSVDAAGRPYGRMLPPTDPLDATDLSHEILETRGDETCDKWAKMPDGTEVAVEVCDPCQGDETDYAIAATVLGETRQIRVSDFVLPPFFDPAGVAPFDRQGAITAPFGMASGGYEARIDATGNETQVFARLAYAGTAHAASVSRWLVGMKLQDPGGRISRRLRAARHP